ncbi:hypothetical protein C9374_001660 [Naegleria lovaniensis]|uniref:Uncharacterized protein n=1 Tax=Naegleria lovaniensis TaxID=51637 RepID=A0AA88GX53_NAELO|nr:uncharacterized protein C9374_001660 [Naegleria lovaniensis]KAG2387328.1 hypothetical protein C9374_001660 [Naegleria lovaniensis]
MNETLEIKLLNASEDDTLRIHHLPCKIDHNGQAQVDKYFEANIKEKGAVNNGDGQQQNGASSSSEPMNNNSVIFEGSFRGRPLQGKQLNFDEELKNQDSLDVTGYIINEDKICVHRFKEFTMWTLDQDPQLEKDIHSSLDWIQFSSIIHQEIKPNL